MAVIIILSQHSWPLLHCLCEREFTAISSPEFLRARQPDIFARNFCTTINAMQKLTLQICAQARCHYPVSSFASFALKGLAEYDSCDSEAKMWHKFDKTMRQVWHKGGWTCRFVIHFVSHETSQDLDRWEPRCLLFRLTKLKWQMVLFIIKH